MSGTPSTSPQGPPGWGNHPPVSRPWLKRMVTSLGAREQLSHVAWKGAFDELRKLLLVPEDPSAFIPLHILSVAKKACEKDIEHFEDFIQQAEANEMLLVDEQRPVSGWSAQCMARMIGFEASHEDDRQWWLASGTSKLVEDLYEEAYIRIHYARYRFIQAEGACDGIGDIETGRELALKGLHHMQTFDHIHQNGRVLAQVSTQIVELEKFIRENGLGGFLPSSY